MPSDVEDGDDVVAGDALDGPGDDLLDLPLLLLLVVRRALPVLVLVQGVTKERAIGMYLKFLMSTENEPKNFVCLMFTVYSSVA